MLFRSIALNSFSVKPLATRSCLMFTPIPSNTMSPRMVWTDPVCRRRSDFTGFMKGRMSFHNYIMDERSLHCDTTIYFAALSRGASFVHIKKPDGIRRCFCFTAKGERCHSSLISFHNTEMVVDKPAFLVYTRDKTQRAL